MEEEIITKEKAKELMGIKASSIGVAIKSDFEYILKKEGEYGLRKMEKEMERLGCEIKYKEIKELNFYPIGFQAIALLVIKKIFDYSDEEFVKIGRFSFKLPTVIRIFMKYFGSLDLLAKQAPKMWNRYYTMGDLKIKEFDAMEGKIAIQVKNFSLTRLHCLTFEGYLSEIVKTVVKKQVKAKETKCVFRGDNYHEFLVEW